MPSAAPAPAPPPAVSAATAALVTLIALAVGLMLPDVDLRLGLGHRSALTHSLLPALLLLASRQRAAACGIAAGVGVHLAADCFPRRMVGYATVKLPLHGALPPLESYGWLALNAAAALLLASWLGRQLHAPVARALVALAALAAALRYLWHDPGGWPVLALAGGVAFVVVRGRRRSLFRHPREGEVLRR
ncbi:hypothetical protein [Sphingomonas sp. BK580]|uniref:hypothetical protein n=1 Tax=Sphingomonas sp. BK580 TaxID=2586972 RepID=UPI001615CC5B|nr:hypothetical protein [Sphingomonas sp. BK580]MBB3694499.1 hypothetical protein [Sphingomonas sp. BK580]